MVKELDGGAPGRCAPSQHPLHGHHLELLHTEPGVGEAHRQAHRAEAAKEGSAGASEKVARETVNKKPQPITQIFVFLGKPSSGCPHLAAHVWLVPGRSLIIKP